MHFNTQFESIQVHVLCKVNGEDSATPGSLHAMLYPAVRLQPKTEQNQSILYLINLPNNPCAPTSILATKYYMLQ